MYRNERGKPGVQREKWSKNGFSACFLEGKWPFPLEKMGFFLGVALAVQKKNHFHAFFFGQTPRLRYTLSSFVRTRQKPNGGNDNGKSYEKSHY
jgi:hypothetical protein